MNKDVNNGQSRREFLGRSVAALAAASFLPSAFSCTGKSVAAPAPVDTAAEAGKVNSKFGGVQIGTITYSCLLYTSLESYFSLPPSVYERSYIEGLEQMRFLENGIKMRVVDVD